MTSPAQSARLSRPFGASLGMVATGIGALLVAVAVALYIGMEGNLADGSIDVRHWLGGIVRRLGAPGSLGLLYIEESGVPLPVPGDVYVTYVGNLASGSVGRLVAAWLAIIAVVTAGASNLYLISKRLGPRLVGHPLAAAFHIDEQRLATAERWFQRWGILAMIFGRHIPGFRVPLTVVAGILGFPYRLFAPAVAVSTAIWAAVFLVLGDRFGRTIGQFISSHAWVYAVGTVAVLSMVAYFLFRSVQQVKRERGRGASV